MINLFPFSFHVRFKNIYAKLIQFLEAHQFYICKTNSILGSTSILGHSDDSIIHVGRQTELQMREFTFVCICSL